MKVPKWLIILVISSLLISVVNLFISAQILTLLFGSGPTTEETVVVPPEPDYKRLISDRYRVDEKVVDHIVTTAEKYSDDTFPTKKDIIVIIGIESSFNLKAKSKLKHDAAVGLTQIRPKVWKHLVKNRKELSTVDGQIFYAVKILKTYYKIVGSKEGAILAYNNGLTAYREGRHSMRYLDKFQRELAYYHLNISKKQPSVTAGSNGIKT